MGVLAGDFEVGVIRLRCVGKMWAAGVDIDGVAHSAGRAVRKSIKRSGLRTHPSGLGAPASFTG